MKEQTALEELIETLKFIQGEGASSQKYFDALLTKDHQQREELVKAVIEDCKKVATKYYHSAIVAGIVKEVEPKYLNK